MAQISEHQKTNRWSNTEKLLQLIKDHPDLPVVPMVDAEVVADDTYQNWLGHWGQAEVTEYYCGREGIHFKDDDEENVLADLEGCMYGCDPQGRDIFDLSDEEWNELYKSVPWIKCIVVYITT